MRRTVGSYVSGAQCVRVRVASATTHWCIPGRDAKYGDSVRLFRRVGARDARCLGKLRVLSGYATREGLRLEFVHLSGRCD
jgi:hypothetical protein